MPQSIVVDIVAIVGIILSNVKTSSYYKVICECRKQRDLGSINPVPLAVSFLNQASWVVYSCVKADLYLLLSVIAGIFTSSFALFSAIKLLGMHGRHKAGRQIEKILLVGLIVWVCLGTFVVVANNLSLAIQMMGYVSLTTSLTNSASPFSSALVIMRTGDASSLYLPAITINLINGGLWVIYGLVVADYFLVMSSGFGMFLAGLQVSMKLYFHYIYSGPVLTKEQAKGKKSDEVELPAVWDNTSLSESPGPDSSLVLLSSEGASNVATLPSTGEHADEDHWLSRARAPTILETVSALLAPLEPFLPEETIEEEIISELDNPAAVEGRAVRSTSIWGAGTGAPAEGPEEDSTLPHLSAKYSALSGQVLQQDSEGSNGAQLRSNMYATGSSTLTSRSRSATLNETPFYYGS